MEKKYHWLKLRKDFFKRHDVRIIEGMENGKDYILFYLKLLVESVGHEGELRFSETIPYDDKMLSTITNTNIDVVRAAISMFTQLGLMEVLSDGTIFLQEVEKMIGYETKWAEKKRNYRLKEAYKPIETVASEDNVLTMSDKSKSKRESKSKSKIYIYTPVCNYLNEKAGTSFRESSSKTKSLIDARVNEGYSENDFKKVIDNKVAEWKGTDMEKYLRPETLFGTKFEAYLNQKTKSIDSNERYKAKEWDPDELR